MPRNSLKNALNPKRLRRCCAICNGGFTVLLLSAGARQRPDFDEFDAGPMQHPGYFSGRGAAGYDIVNHGNVLVTAAWPVCERLTQVVNAVTRAETGLQARRARAPERVPVDRYIEVG